MNTITINFNPRFYPANDDTRKASYEKIITMWARKGKLLQGSNFSWDNENQKLLIESISPEYSKELSEITEKFNRTNYAISYCFNFPLTMS